MANKSDIEADLTRARARLANLDAERSDLQHEVQALEILLALEKVPAAKQPSFENAPVTNTSSSRKKVDLFRRLFAGRPDVFPVRWDNKKTGRSGYSPACANEWVKGICEKVEQTLHQSEGSFGGQVIRTAITSEDADL